jgi:hypothetical protein
LNKDGIPEIIVNDNLGQGRLMPEGFKYYDKSQITSLSWNQLGLVENWKTMEVGGMVTAFRIGDLTKGGVPQLIGSMVLAKDLLKVWDSKSTVFSYDLNIAPSKLATNANKQVHPDNEYPSIDKKEWTWQEPQLFDGNRAEDDMLTVNSSQKTREARPLDHGSARHTIADMATYICE